MEINANTKIGEVRKQFEVDMHALNVEHKKMVKAFYDAMNALTKYNAETWKPMREKLMAKFEADRAEIKRLQAEAKAKEAAEKQAKKASKKDESKVEDKPVVEAA